VKYKSFEELPAWNAAIEVAVRTFAMTASGQINGYAGLRDQLERAAVSISNNIAEGFERGTHNELLTFLYYALGSAGEVRSMLLLIPRLPGGDALRPHLDELLPMARNVSRQLCGWIEALKDSPSQGPRHQNTTTRTAQVSAQRRRDFLEELERVKNQERNVPAEDQTDP
jgi:four helix bundle protein